MNKLFSCIVCGVAGFATFSVAFASVPRHVTDDAALYQNLSEIRVAREKELNFDRDIAQLSSMEGRYKERLPKVSPNSRIKAPMQRISQRKYVYSGAKARSRTVSKQSNP